MLFRLAFVRNLGAKQFSCRPGVRVQDLKANASKDQPMGPGYMHHVFIGQKTLDVGGFEYSSRHECLLQPHESGDRCHPLGHSSRIISSIDRTAREDPTAVLRLAKR